MNTKLVAVNALTVYQFARTVSGDLVFLAGSIHNVEVVLANVGCGTGSEVEIFGEKNDIRTLSDAANTIPYEFLCAVSKRVPRVYK
ncbi:MAG: hypothetical protein IIW85_02140 [Bacteroidaceae bacterium]|nr:hypothetical protein [Bacteroidaceae bacterium]